MCGEIVKTIIMDNELSYFGINDNKYSKNPSRHNLRKDNERTLYNDLENYNISKAIIEKANDYYKNIIKENIYRAKNRTAIVFACVYYAYKSQNEEKNIKDLARNFNLDQKGITKGFKIFNEKFKNRDDKKYTNALDLVPIILNKTIENINIENKNNYYKDITLIYNFIINKNYQYSSSSPQSVAAGLVYYYFKYLLKNNPNRKNFSNSVQLTDITFTGIADQIKKDLNK